MGYVPGNKKTVTRPMIICLYIGLVLFVLAFVVPLLAVLLYQ